MELSSNSGWAAANIPISSSLSQKGMKAKGDVVKDWSEKEKGSGEEEEEEDDNDDDEVDAGDGEDSNYDSGGGWVPLGNKTRRRNSGSRKTHVSSSTMKRANRETAEAAVSRLTTCYNSALKCIAAMHRLDKAFVVGQKERSSSDDESNSNNHTDRLLQLQEECYRVARSAKSLLQNTILSDPLLSIYIPTLRMSLATDETIASSSIDTRSNLPSSLVLVGTTTPTMPTLSSTHQKSLRDLAYLSLLNYADLLMLGTTTSSTTPPSEGSFCSTNTTSLPTQQMDILSRGVILPLHCLTTPRSISSSISSSNYTSLWEEEEEDPRNNSTTIRLALSAYIDATQIDPTDPTTWLKLACAARAFSRTERITFLLQSKNKYSTYVSSSKPTTTDNEQQQYQQQQLQCILDCYRLEVYAIQRGILAVPSTLPPNRLLLHAMHSLQHNRYQDCRIEPSNLAHSSSSTAIAIRNKVIVHATHHTLHINLTRYSWNTLGRSLLRAYRDASSFPLTVQYYHYINKEDRHAVGDNDGYNRTNILLPYQSTDSNVMIAIPTDSSIKYQQDHLPSTYFGSPTVEIQMVPIIAYLSVSNLATVCSFLDPLDIQRLEVSCRAISSAVMASRTRMEEEQQKRLVTSHYQKEKQQQEEVSHQESQQMPPVDKMDHPTELEALENTSTKKDYPDITDHEENEGERRQPAQDETTQQLSEEVEEEGSSTQHLQAEASSHNDRKGPNRTRSSTRVRSQRLLSQDRQSADSSYRNSVDRCVAFSIFGYNLDYPFRQSVSALLSSMKSADGAPIDDVAKLLDELIRESRKETTYWLDLPPLRKGAEVLRKTSIFKKYNGERHQRKDSVVSDCDDAIMVNSSAHIEKRRITEIQSRMSLSSLNSFVDLCGQNSGPLDIIERYLTHVSLHVQDVFTSEQTNDGVMMLSSCLLDCFDSVAARDGQLRSLAAPYWVGSVDPTSLLHLGAPPLNAASSTSAISTSQGLKVFSMNLLVAELKLRQCDRQQLEVNDIDSDTAAVSYLVPTLVEIAKAWNVHGVISNESLDTRTVWCTLNVRTHWLASAFYLWWSNSSVVPLVSSRVEQLSLDHLDMAVEALDNMTTNPIKAILTPHLESPSRTGKHWRELSKPNLITYKEEIRAASIVSHARMEFMQIRERVQACSQEHDEAGLNLEEQYFRLKGLGRDLLGRYGEYRYNWERYEDLIRDFLSCSNIRNMLLQAGRDGSYEQPFLDFESLQHRYKKSGKNSSVVNWGSVLWDVIPYSIDSMKAQFMGSSSNPSLIEILAVCCIQEPELNIPFLHVLVRLVLSAFDQRSKIKALRMKNLRQEVSRPTFFGDRDSSSESSEECESDSSSLANYGGDDKSEYLLLLIAKFFMEKISHLFSEIAPKLKACSHTVLAFEDFISNAEVQAMLQISFCVAAKSNDLAEFFPFSSKTTNYDNVTEKSFTFGADVNNATSALSNKLRCLPDRSMLWISYGLIHSLLSYGNDDKHRPLENLLFILLSKSLVEEQVFLASLLLQRGDRRSRSMKQRTCLAIGDFVADIAVIFSDLLLLFPFNNVEGVLHPSSLVQSLAQSPLEGWKNGQACRSCDTTALELVSLINISDSLLWFWRHFSNNGTSDTGLTPFRAADAVTVKSLSQRLETPISCALIAFFGSFVNSTSIYLLGVASGGASDDNEYDAVDYSSCEDEDGNSNDANLTLKRSVLALSHLVKGISVIYTGVKDRNALSFFAPVSGHHGPLFPITVSKTLNNVTDIFLDTIKKKNDSILWAETYPRGLEAIGFDIDSLLSKAYSSLHGFNLTGGSQDVLKSALFFPPESLIATLRIFRLIKRLYPSNGRRVPPRAALECVSRYLPDTKGNEQDAAIRNFIFCHEVISSESVAATFTNEGRLSSNLFPPQFPLWLLKDKSDTVTTADQKVASKDPDFDGIPWNVLRRVQMELTRDLARVPIPRMGLSNNHSKSSIPATDETSEGSRVDEREVLARYEFAIWQKIDAIINYLCFSPDDCKGWFDVAQCISSKADYIRDRIVTNDDEYVERDFFPWPSVFNRERQSTLYSLEALERKYKIEDEQIRLHSLPCLGRDLSVYLRNPWSKISTIHECAEEIGKVICSHETMQELEYEQETASTPELTEIVAFNCIQSLEPGMWQNAWGGLYIGALQIMAHKCLEVAYFLAKQNEIKSISDRNRNESFQLVAEVCEAMGTLLYKELQGSWQYGYPIRRMTRKRRCDLAERAMNKYKESLDLFVCSSSGKEDFNATWGLQLMIGKCYEKMARTYSLEWFSRDSKSEQNHSIPYKRKYAYLLEQAFLHYSESLDTVKRAEKDGLLTEQQMGGCSHGSIEVLYRIHAARLKVLLHAVSQDEKKRSSFEVEALNLVSNSWFSEPIDADNEEGSLTLNDKERRWEVLVDIVSALVFCRQEKAHFHRSVYRHAQAILWAPIVYNPNAERYPLLITSEGILNQPNVLSNIYQGGVCANAAKIVMDSIFDKKRTQLCAMWLESRPHRAFEELNQSEKKFDSVRLKYIAARVELLRVCHDLESLQTFSSWANSCLPDLPSLYFATATGGFASRHDHLRDNLLEGRGFLRNVKRLCTMAIADVVLFQLLQNSKADAADGWRVKAPMDLLRIAYFCFLKLNCSIEDLSWFEEAGEENVIEVDALLSAFEEVKGTIADSINLEDKMKASGTDDTDNKKVALLQVVLARCKALFSTRKYRRKSAEERGDGIVQAEHNTVIASPTRKRPKKSGLLVI